MRQFTVTLVGIFLVLILGCVTHTTSDRPDGPTAFAAREGLPDMDPPFAAKELKVQPVELKVGNAYNQGVIQTLPYLMSGNKKVSARDGFIHPCPTRDAKCFYVMVDGKALARCFLIGWIPGTEYGYPFQTKDGAVPQIAADKAQQSFSYKKEYYLNKDNSESAVYTQTASPAGNGKVLFSYDAGISPERFAALPKTSGIGPTIRLESQALDLGVSVNGNRLTFTPVSELMKLPKDKNGVISKPAETRENCDEITVSPDNPASGFTFRLSQKGTITLSEGYYQDRHTVGIGLPPGPDKVKGSFVIDMGVSTAAAADAPPPLGAVDFWGRDRMHVLAPTTRNMLPNPSFEQGLRYWRWIYGGVGGDNLYVPQPNKSPCYEITHAANFGHSALKLNSTQGNKPIMSFPIPVTNGKDYTVSFYAKADKPAPLNLGAATAVIGAKPDWSAFNRGWKIGTEWERHAFTFKAETPAIQIAIHGWGNIVVDGIQLEEGEKATEFVSPDVEGRLATSDPDNSLQPGKPFNTVLELSGVPGLSGEALVTVFDYYREKLYERKHGFTLDDKGLGRIQLPLDDRTLGTGVFVVRADYRVPGKPPLTDYYRMSVMAYLNGTHATSELFGNTSIAGRITRGDDLARMYVRWGWGSYSPGDPAKYELMRKYGIACYCATVADLMDETQQRALYGDDYKDYSGHGTAKFRTKLDSLTSDDKVKLVEDISYAVVKKYPAWKVWSWDGESDGRSTWIRSGNYAEHAKLIMAMYRGVKRAMPDAIVLPDQGPANLEYTAFEQIEGFLSSTKGKVKWGAVAIHPYIYPDEFDRRTRQLIGVMEKCGYGKDTPIYFTESGNTTDVNIPEWGENGCYDSYWAGRPTYDTGWREFLKTAWEARLYLNTLKYWPQTRYASLWTGTPFLDLDFAPLMICKMVNTLGHLFGNPTFVADIIPMEGVKGLSFEDDHGRGLVALWSTGNGGDVERGLKKAPKLRVTFGLDAPEFIDLMGNVRPIKPSKGRYDVQLTPAPLFIRGPKGSAARLAAALNGAQVIGAGSTVKADVLPALDGRLIAELSNQTARDLSGTLKIGKASFPFTMTASGKMPIEIAEDLATASGKIQNWHDKLNIVLDDGTSTEINYSTAWFFVPHVSEPLPPDPNAPEWRKIPAISVTNWLIGKDVTGGQPGDLGATFQTAWDKDNLYLRVACTDDKFLSDMPAWQAEPLPVTRRNLYGFDGCAEVYLDTRANGRSNVGKGHDEDDYRYDFYAADGNAANGPGNVCRLYKVFHQLAGGLTFPTDEEAAQGVKCEFRRSGNSYSYVMIFPQRYIQPFELTQGHAAGFGLYIHDKEPGDKNPAKGLSLATEPGAHCNYRPHLYPLMILGD